CSAFMFTTVSRKARARPAARTAPKEDPYSTSRRSWRLYHTRCGISWTSGNAPVASDERHTGGKDGKTEVAVSERPSAGRAASVGAKPRSTAASSMDGVSPSTTTTITFFVLIRDERYFASVRSPA